MEINKVQNNDVNVVLSEKQITSLKALKFQLRNMNRTDDLIEAKEEFVRLKDINQLIRKNNLYFVIGFIGYIAGFIGGGVFENILLVKVIFNFICAFGVAFAVMSLWIVHKYVKEKNELLYAYLQKHELDGIKGIDMYKAMSNGTKIYEASIVHKNQEKNITDNNWKENTADKLVRVFRKPVF